MNNKSSPQRSSSFKRNTVVYGISLVAERIVSLLLIPVLTKALPVELFGVWSQIIVTASLASGILLLQLHTAFVKFYAGVSAAEKRKGFHGLAILCLLNFGLFALLTRSTLSFSTNLVFGNPAFSPYLRALVWLLGTEVLLELLGSYLRADERIQRLSVYYLVRYVGRTAIMLAALLVFSMNLLSAINLLAAWQLLLSAYIYLVEVRINSSTTEDAVDCSVSAASHIEILHFALPLVPIGILTWINNFSNRYYILHLLDMKAVGIYSVAYSLAGGIIGFLYSVVGYTLFPRLSKLWSSGAKGEVSGLVQQVILYYLFLALPIIAGLTLLNDAFVSTLSTHNYVSDWKVILFLSLSVGLFGLYQIFLYVTLLGGKTYSNLTSMAVATSINLALNLLLIPHLGLVGASLAGLVSNAVLAGWTILIAREVTHFHVPLQRLARIGGAVLVMMAVVIVMQKWIGSGRPASLLSIVISSGLIYLWIDKAQHDSLIARLMRP